MMKRYQILYGETSSELEDCVNRYINMGWVPTGGVSVSSTGRMLMQALYYVPSASELNKIIAAKNKKS